MNRRVEPAIGLAPAIAPAAPGWPREVLVGNP